MAYLIETIPVRHLDNNGNPISGVLLYSFAAGTETPLATYTDSSGGTPLPNPIVSDSQGYFPQPWVSASAYKFRAKKPDGTTVWERDNVWSPSAIADQIRTDLADLSSASKGGAMVGYNPSRAYGAGTVGASLRRRISVGDYVDAGLTHVEAFQAAVTEAKARIASSSALSWFGAAIHVPSDRNWDLNGLSAPLAIDKSGICFYGDPGRGGRIVRNGTIFDVGDYTNATRVTMFGLYNLVLDTGVGNSSAVGVKLYRTSETRVVNVTSLYFDIHYDLYRSSTSHFINLRMDNSGRTANATAFWRLQGTDETAFTVPAEYTPGGGGHYYDIEAHHDGGAYYTGACFQIKAVDGFYPVMVHATGCARLYEIIPDATPANYVVTDIHAMEQYFDNPPSGISPSLVCGYYIGGTVDPTITMADSSSKKSIYQNLWFLQCYARGSYLAQHGALIEIADPGGAYVTAGEKVSDIKFHAGEYSGATRTGIRAKGATTTNLEVDGLDILGATIGNNNQAGTANIGSGVDLEAASCSVRSNTFTEDAGTTSYNVRLVLTNTGSGDSGAAIVTDNNFHGTTPTAQDVFYNAAAGAKVVIADNLPSGPGQRIWQSYPGRTTDRSPLILWSATVQDGQSIMVETTCHGSSVSGTLAANRAQYRQRLDAYKTSGTTTVQLSSDITAYENVTGNDAPINLVLMTGTAWSASAATAARALITSGGNLYLALVAGTLDATTAPVHTSSVVTNGAVPLGYVGPVAVNMVGLIVSGAASIDMSWSSRVHAEIVP